MSIFNFESTARAPDIMERPEMKARWIGLLAVVVALCVLASVATRVALMGDASPEDFHAFVRDRAPYPIVEERLSSAARLPPLISIRFPQSDMKGGLGFPDRTVVYSFRSEAGAFECHAHHRQNRVCLVTFEDGEPPVEFRDQLRRRFPGLSIR